MKLITVTFFVVLIASCEKKLNTETDYLNEIQKTEDSLKKIMPEESTSKTNLAESQKRYLELLISFYQKFPKSKKAPLSLDKAHMVYSGMGDYKTSSRWADTLLNNYPNYSNRALVLESQAFSYDAFIRPRDTVKVRLYYTKLLNEFPSLPREKRKDILRRLEYNSVPFENYLNIQKAESSVIQ